MWLAKIASLELQPGLARGVGQSFDASVINVASTIEDHLLDSRRHRPFGDQLADSLGAGQIAAAVRETRLLGGAGGNQGLMLTVVNPLRVNVLERAVYVQARTLRPAAQLAANA